jgi:ribosome-associated translation inhibitor RaiA
MRVNLSGHHVEVPPALRSDAGRKHKERIRDHPAPQAQKHGLVPAL